MGNVANLKAPSPMGKFRKRGTLARANGKNPKVSSKGVTARVMTPAEAATNPKVGAQNALRPILQAANVIGVWGRGLDVPALADELYKQSVRVIDGTMERPEAMLVSQAHPLDIIFNALGRKPPSTSGRITSRLVRGIFVLASERRASAAQRSRRLRLSRIPLQWLLFARPTLRRAISR